jgi:hypothetical protein
MPPERLDARLAEGGQEDAVHVVAVVHRHAPCFDRRIGDDALNGGGLNTSH